LIFFISTESDFIDVPSLPIRSEPIILPELTTDERIETSINNTSSEFIELDQDDESSHNSTAIEDIKMLINDDNNQSSIIDIEAEASLLSQSVNKVSCK
jgi:hypothetical protein